MLSRRGSFHRSPIKKTFVSESNVPSCPLFHLQSSIFEKSGFKRMQKVLLAVCKLKIRQLRSQTLKRERTSTLEGKIKKIGSAFSTAFSDKNRTRAGPRRELKVNRIGSLSKRRVCSSKLITAGQRSRDTNEM